MSLLRVRPVTVLHVKGLLKPCNLNGLVKPDTMPIRTDIPWNDFRSTAAWKTKRRTPRQFCEKFGGHRLFHTPGLHPLAISLDVLHTFDLGLSLHLLWSVMENMDGGRDVAWQELWDEVREQPSRTIWNRILAEG